MIIIIVMVIVITMHYTRDFIAIKTIIISERCRLRFERSMHITMRRASIKTIIIIILISMFKKKW